MKEGRGVECVGQGQETADSAQTEGHGTGCHQGVERGGGQ